MTRPRLSKGQKRALRLIELHGDICHYCHDELTDGNRTLDHVVPASQDGSGSLHNFVLACYPCNHYRGKMDYAEFAELIRVQIAEGRLTRKQNGGTTVLSLSPNWGTVKVDIYKGRVQMPVVRTRSLPPQELPVVKPKAPPTPTNPRTTEYVEKWRRIEVGRSDKR